MSSHDELLAETIARHFPRAATTGTTVALGFADVCLECKVNGIRAVGQQKSASLFLWLRGGALGEAPIFASASGYGASAQEAIITGACHWATVFGPVLQTALTNTPVASDADLTVFETMIDGRRYRVVLDGFDRAMALDDAVDVSTVTTAARQHLGAAPWLTPRILSSGLLPMLPSERPTILSVFCWESREQRTLEVKVNGVDWPDCVQLLDTVPYLDQAGAALLRELAVLVPLDGAPPPTRNRVECTLRGAERLLYGEPRVQLSWPGWTQHGGELGPSASELDLARLESAIGDLPGDYRAFLASVAASGAGPGYGLISPFGPAQLELATGDFDWADGETPEAAPQGVIALAHGGCGVMWLLVLRGPHRGSVWVDGGGSDEIARLIAPSFTAWYSEWLDSIIRNEEQFVQWDVGCCAAPAAFSQFLDAQNEAGKTNDEALESLVKQMKPRAMALSSGGGPYFDAGDALFPCHGCCRLATRLGLSVDIFQTGTVPRQARQGDPSVSARSWGHP